MIGVTLRQKQALDFIRSYGEANGYPPSYQEIADALGLRSKSGIQRLVHGLMDRGLITSTRDKARSIAMGPNYKEIALRLSTHLLAYQFREAEKIARDLLAANEAAQ